MKKIILTLSLLLCIIFLQAQSPMSGTYLIHPALVGPSTFNSFQEAMDSLAFNGVGGPVTINVSNSTYNEQVEMSFISGTSAVNTVTFNGNNATLQNSTTSSTARHTLRISGADYIRFKHLNFINTNSTYAYAVQMYNGANYNVFDSCTMTVPANLSHNDHAGIVFNVGTGEAASSSAAAGCSNDTIKNCSIVNGYYGVVLNGSTGLSNGSNFVENCTIEDFRNFGVYMARQNSSTVSKNNISRPLRTALSTFYGVYSTTGVVNSLIEKNRIHDPFEANTSATNTSYGVRIFSDGTLGSENKIVNNLIYNFKSNGSMYGIGTSTANYLDIYHNTIDIDNPTSTTSSVTRGIYQIGASSLGQDFRNNIVTINRGGTGQQSCIWIAATGTICDYNNFTITPGANHWFGVDGGNYATLSAWQLSAGGGGVYDQNSYSLNPYYESPPVGNFKPTQPALNNQGTGVGVGSDIEGTARFVAPPDIGAYEFVGCSPMAGTYSINPFLPPSPTNFSNWQGAVDKLILCGVGAPVTINLFPSHTFNEQIDIPQISGTSNTNTVTFNGNNATLTNASVGTDSSHTLRLSGADHFSFKNMTIQTNGVTSGVAVHLYNNSNNNLFDSCIIQTLPNSNSFADASFVINASNSINIGVGGGYSCDSITLMNSTIKNGFHGVYAQGDTFSTRGGHKIINCTIEDVYTGIKLVRLDGSHVSRNNIWNPTRTTLTQFVGIELAGNTSNSWIEKNRIHDPYVMNDTLSSFDANGIRPTSVSTLGNEDIIENNLIYNFNSNNAIYGIATGAAQYVIIRHNTIVFDDSSSTAVLPTLGIAQDPSWASNHTIKNNIIYVTRGGTGTKRCLDFSGSSFDVDNNDLYIKAGPDHHIGNWMATNFTTLSSWQTANSNAYDQNSLDANPNFVSPTLVDFTPTNLAINNLGDALGVLTDFNDMTRDASTPDPGAIEFGCDPLAGTYTINPSLPADTVNFQTIDSAVQRMVSCGISAPVIFNMAPGHTFNEQIDIPEIAGSSVLNTVTFNGNNDTITHDAVSSTSRHTVRLSGADYFRFNHVNFQGTDSTYANIVHLHNGSHNAIFDSCTFSALPNLTGYNVHALVSICHPYLNFGGNSGPANDSTIIRNCKVYNCSGFTFSGKIGDSVQASQVLDCEFVDFANNCVEVVRTLDMVVRGNKMWRPNRTAFFGPVFAINMNNFVRRILIEKNHIHDLTDGSPGSGTSFTGIYTTTYAAASNENILRNNIIDMSVCRGSVIGISLSGDYMKIHHNTIVMKDVVSAAGTAPKRGISQTHPSALGIEIMNNNIHQEYNSSQPKHCLYLSSPNVSSNYNNLFQNSPIATNRYTGYFGGHFVTLANWQTANLSAWDQNSVALNPIYEESADAYYRPTNIDLDNQGTSIGVLSDYLDTIRSLANPDIGAFEFEGCIPKDLVLATTSNTSSNTGLFIDSTVYNDGDSLAFRTLDCKLLASITDTLGGNILGEVVFNVNVDPSVQTHNMQPYVRRWYEIEPSSNGPANVVLYLTQDDFDDYNVYATANAWPLLPVNNLDIAGIANIRVTKIDGGGLGVGSPLVITPSSIWNATGARWELSFPVSSFSQFYIHAANPGNVPLPISGLRFTAKKLNAHSLLEWQTNAEVDNNLFNVQRSGSGANFQTIGTVNSKAINGNSHEKLQYSFEDVSPLNGSNFYRLERVSLSGKKEYSETVNLVWSNDILVKTYPNPVRENLNIKISAPTTEVYFIRILDVGGRILIQRKVKGIVGNTKFELNLTSLSSGLYSLEIRNRNGLLYRGKISKQ